jgi:pyrroline-5-carboxylate reductase
MTTATLASHSTASAAAPPAVSLLDPGRTLGVIGAGVMGQTILKGLLDQRLLAPDQVWATSRTQASCDRVAGRLGIAVEPDYASRLGQAQILILCVKPAQITALLEGLRNSGLPPDALLVSIAAGVKLKALTTALATDHAWVRAMPNTPCVVGHGMTAICGGGSAKPADLERARLIFSSVGRCVPLDEQHFNAVTALSASGPAYMYLMMEALADAGVRVGLPRDTALTLVAQTMLGAARMVQDSGRHPAALRDDVTTPAGCTIGGLLMLEDGKIRSVLARAVEEATRIASNLGAPKGAD